MSEPNGIPVELARIHYEITSLREHLERVEAAQKLKQEKVDRIDAAANRWKGGFAVIIALGLFVGWIASTGGSILKLFK